MADKPRPDPNADLHRTLNNACRKCDAREIRLRYLPKPSLNRWIAEALIDHRRVIDKIRADIPLANSQRRTWGGRRRPGTGTGTGETPLSYDVVDRSIKSGVPLERAWGLF